jgi:epoxyqueuosine reductase QueG
MNLQENLSKDTEVTPTTECETPKKDATRITRMLREELEALGADAYGFADLRGLPSEQRDDFAYGISVGYTLDAAVLRGIACGPTPAYHDNYDRLNLRLDETALHIQSFLEAQGFRAQGNVRALVGTGEGGNHTKLPHKTVATRAGLGWIGKCALLVTENFGSGIRITSILTDAPLEVAEPINDSRCGDCSVCQRLCPAHAVSGRRWYAGLAREKFWDADACRKTARARSLDNLHEEITLCGLCILMCPHTQRSLKTVGGRSVCPNP